MIKVLKHIDIFAPHFEFQVQENETRFSTKVGGMTTLVVFLLSAIYGILKGREWYYNEVQPIVTSYITSMKQIQSVDLFELNITMTDYQDIIPILRNDVLQDQNKQAVVPYLQIINGIVIQTILLTKNCSAQITNHNVYCISEEDKSLIKLSVDPQNSKNTKMTVYFVKCNYELIKNTNFTCASEIEIQEYLTVRPFWRIEFDLKTFDLSRLEFNTVRFEHGLTIRPELLFAQNLKFVRSNIVVDKGYQIVSPEEYTFFQDFNIVNYDPPLRSIIPKYSKEGLYGLLFISCSSLEHHIKIQYIKITDLCVLIFAFINLLLSLGKIIVKRRTIFRILTKLSNLADIKEEGHTTIQKNGLSQNVNIFELMKLITQMKVQLNDMVKERNQVSPENDRVMQVSQQRKKVQQNKFIQNDKVVMEIEDLQFVPDKQKPIGNIQTKIPIIKEPEEENGIQLFYASQNFNVYQFSSNHQSSIEEDLLSSLNQFYVYSAQD